MKIIVHAVGFLVCCSVAAGQPGTLRAEWAEQAAAAEAAGRMVVAGTEGWLFLAAELRHLAAGPFWGAAAAAVSRAADPAKADPLPAILDVQRQLDDLGIKLLLVPVPPKAAFCPENRAEEGLRPHREFYSLLAAQGVDVLDLAPVFQAAMDAGEEPLYCRQDSHWSGRACALAAEAIAGRLEGLSGWAVENPVDVEERSAEIELTGDLWLALDEPRPPRERLHVRRVLAAGEPVSPDRASPVLLLGDSHVLVFHAGGDLHATGAGLADHLARRRGAPVDVLGVRGSGATPARVSLYRRSRADPAYLAGKTIVLWCFGAREFTESSGWDLVPLR